MTNSFCYAGGGTWPTVQALITFLTTNIFAHAATIYLVPGSDASLTVVTVFQALLLPVNAGDFAIHAISRYVRRLRKRQIGVMNAIGGFTFEDAATAGAIAISVPLRFAPLLQGRWDSVTDQQRLVMLDNEEFWHGEDWGPRGNPGGLPFDVSAKEFRYIPYILPPTTKFPGYANYKISPQSSALPKVIAIIQLVLSVRSIYLKYDSSIVAFGLSSPFLVVVPYLLMTLVNLLANTLVGSYTQVVVLPMEEDNFPKPNQVYIGGWLNEEAGRIVALLPDDEPPAGDASSTVQTKDVVEEGSSTHLPARDIIPTVNTRPRSHTENSSNAEAEDSTEKNPTVVEKIEAAVPEIAKIPRRRPYEGLSLVT